MTNKTDASFLHADGSVTETKVKLEPMRTEDDAERARLHAEWRAKEEGMSK